MNPWNPWLMCESRFLLPPLGGEGWGGGIYFGKVRIIESRRGFFLCATGSASASHPWKLQKTLAEPVAHKSLS